MTREELFAARRIREEIKQMEYRLKTLRMLSTNTTPFRDGLSNRSADSSLVEKYVVQAADLEAELQAKRALYDQTRIALLEKIQATDLKESVKRVIMLRYVACMNFRDICFELGYSDAHVFRLHADALKMIVG